MLSVLQRESALKNIPNEQKSRLKDLAPELVNATRNKQKETLVSGDMDATGARYIAACLQILGTKTDEKIQALEVARLVMFDPAQQVPNLLEQKKLTGLMGKIFRLSAMAVLAADHKDEIEELKAEGEQKNAAKIAALEQTMTAFEAKTEQLEAHYSKALKGVTDQLDEMTAKYEELEREHAKLKEALRAAEQANQLAEVSQQNEHGLLLAAMAKIELLEMENKMLKGNAEENAKGSVLRRALSGIVNGVIGQ